MMASSTFEAPDPVGLVLIILIGGISAASLAGYGFSSAMRQGAGRKGVARGFAALAASAMAAMYVWGAFHLIMDETMTDRACKEAVGPERAGRIDGYAPSYMPLGLDCHVRGSGTYVAAVPGYVNPSVLALGLIAAVLGGIAAAAPEPGARDNHVDRETS
ncbi:hypothetical protein ACFV30_29135 [Streptomyces sp. NPDC059752]|uniref:hypothetical protein n=1 Tax=unclassified Streptomyces TaxID=2593676 RepID=UPI00364613ED